MIRRLFKMMRRNPLGTLAVTLGLGVWSTIAVNAALLQEAPHPAPLLGRSATWQMPVAAIPKPKPETWASEVVPGTFEEDARRREQEAQQDLVRELQGVLTERGFYVGPLDGLEGPLTEQAIRAYERMAELDESGAPSAALLAHVRLSAVKAAPVPPPNPATQEAGSAEPALAETEESSDPPSMASLSETADDDTQSGQPTLETLISSIGDGTTDVRSDPRIEAVQQVLANLGYAPGPVDGQLGRETQAAIRRFEADRDLAPTGEISQRLLDELSVVSGESFG